MARFILARLFKAVIILFCIAVLNFLLIHSAPGDPAQIMAGEAAKPMRNTWLSSEVASAWINRFLSSWESISLR